MSKLGSTISKLFSNNGNLPKPEEKPSSAEDLDDKPENITLAKNEMDSSITSKNGTSTEIDKPKAAKPKLLTIKEPIESTIKTFYVSPLRPEQLEEVGKKLETLNQEDKERSRREAALNVLESFVIDSQTKLSEKEYSSASTPEEIETIKKACSQVSNWLYEDGSEADAKTYEMKLSELKTLTKHLYLRVVEHKERPEALKALTSMINGSRTFFASAQNLTKTRNEEKSVFTDFEISELKTVIDSTQSWMDEQVQDQEKLKKWEPVKLTVKAISEKMGALDREVKYLVNKLQRWRPKTVEKPAKELQNKTTEGEQATVKSEVKDDEVQVVGVTAEKEVEEKVETSTHSVKGDESEDNQIKIESETNGHTEL